MKLVFVLGTRGNFVKVASLIKACRKKDISFKLVHTGQHYDDEMSGVFFRDLGMPQPDLLINSQNLSTEQQEDKIKKEFEDFLSKNTFDFVVVVGDVRSTLAASIAAKKSNQKLVHVEAGIRSFDSNLPEEEIRRKVDALSDICFVPERRAIKNLINEKSKAKIFFVGSMMVDALNENLPLIKSVLKKYNFPYAVSTLHRQENILDEANLTECIRILNYIAEKRLKIVMPLHPRTRANINKFSIHLSKNIIDINPVGYVDLQSLIYNSEFVITDSGTIEEETTFIGKPCLTMRPSTERPDTVFIGTNTLVYRNFKLAIKNVDKILSKSYKKGKIPKFWDGKSSDRIIRILIKELN